MKESILGRKLINEIYSELNVDVSQKSAAETEKLVETQSSQSLGTEPGVAGTRALFSGAIESKEFRIESEDALELGDIELQEHLKADPPREANPSKFVQFLAECKKNIDSGYRGAVSAAIENFFLDFPYKKTDWSKFSEDELQSMLKSLEELQYLYGENAEKMDGKPFAERSITMALAQMLGVEVFQAYFKDNPNVRNTCNLYLLGKNFGLVKESLDSPYFTVLDPKFRAKIPLIRKEYEPKLSVEQQADVMQASPDKLFHLLMDGMDEQSKAELENFLAAEKKIHKRTGECAFGDFMWEMSGDVTFFEKLEKMPKESKLLHCYLTLFGRANVLGTDVTENQKVFREKLPMLGKKLSMVLDMLQMGHFSNLALQGRFPAFYRSSRYCEEFGDILTDRDVKIHQAQSGEYNIQVSDPFEREYESQNSVPLSETQTSFTDSDINSILSSRSDSSNAIQTETMKSVLDEKVSLMRQLKNMRLKPETQVIQAVDFIKSHLFKVLLDQDLQLYTFLTIFQTPLLEQQLVKSPEVLNDILKIIEGGIEKYSKDNIIKPEILFFYKMALSCHEACLNIEESSKDTEMSQRLKARFGALNDFKKNLSNIEAQLPALISNLEKKLQNKAVSKAVNEDLLYQLQLFNVENIGIKLQERKQCTESEILSLISAIIYLANHKTPETKDIYFSHLVSQTIAKIEAPLNERLSDLMSKSGSRSFLVKSFNEIAKQYGIDAGQIPSHWEVKPPNLTLIANDTHKKRINLNLLTGIVSRESMALKPKLPEVLENKVFKSCFNVDEISGFASPNRNRFEFQIEELDYRLIIKPRRSMNTSGALQRKVAREGKTTWFELCYSKPPLDLPLPMQGINLKLWMSLDTLSNGKREMLIIDSKTNKPLYQYDGSKIYELDALGKKSSHYLLDQKSLQALLRQFPSLENFEDPKFIMAFKSDVPPEIKIVLPRYNLSFVALGDETFMSDLVLEQDPRYKLKTSDTPQMIPNFNSMLWLDPAGKELVKEQVLIPEQHFLATAGHEKEYYRLEFDRKAEVKKNILLNKKVFRGISLIDATEWRGSEHYSSYTASKSKVGISLLPDSNRSRFYLAYLYLARRQPILANEVLQAALKEESPLTEDDLNMLRKILFEIPVDLQNKEDSYAATRAEALIDSPEFVAIRMQVFSLLAKQKLSDYTINIAESRELQSGTKEANNEFQKLLQQQLKQFWNSPSLAWQMRDFMEDYLKKLKYIPTELKLSETQELQIIRFIMFYYKKDMRSEIPPNIMYRRRVLELNLLNKEKDNLLELQTKGKLGIQGNKRLEQISARIADFPKVMTEEFQYPKDHKTELLSPPREERGSKRKEIPDYDFQDISFSWVGKEEVSQPVIATYAKKVALPNPKIVEDTKGAADVKGRLESQVRFRKMYKEIYQDQIAHYNVKKKVDALYGQKKIKEKVLASLYKEDKEEYRKGLLNNLKLKARQEASEQFYHQNLELDQGKSFRDKIEAAIKTDEASLASLQAEILKLANLEPSDAKKRGEWRLQKAARQMKDLNLNEILHLFLQKDQVLYKAKTSLNDEQILLLQQKVFDFLLQSSQQQYQKRLLEQLDILSKKKVSKDVLMDAVHQIGMLLSMKRCYKPEQHPEILLFEYLDNKLIYPEQFHYIKTLMKKDREGYVSQIIKLIMGGGKSKVLLPLLALEKANGSNLVVMEVPQALFQINRVDLNVTTVLLFGREAKAFIFDESIKLTPEHLLNLKRRLRLIMQNRDYLVTTKESMQALELKYLKLLRFADLSDKEDRIMLRHLADIIRIFKHQGDFLIDEVDSTLDIRKQLIYTVGSNRRLSKEISAAAYNFFEFLDTKQFLINKKSYTLKQILTQERTPTKEQWPLLLEQVLDKFLNDAQSPLLKLLTAGGKKKLSIVEKKELTNYFLGKAKSVPNIVKALDVDEKEIIALYKLQLESLLVSTLSKKKNENYGRTKDLSKPEMLQEIAIPYAASDTPNEKSRFKNSIETLNYTYQMQYGEPVSKALVTKFVAEFKQLYEQEQKRGIAELKTGAEARFLELTGESLSNVDLNNEQSVNAFWKHVADIPAVKKHCMINFVFHSIEESEEYLASDAHNHCGQGRSIQGMTGTDWNKRCMPKFIETKQALAGSDGQVIDYLSFDAVAPHLMQETVTGYEKTMAAALKLLESNPKKSVFHAWIDLGAHFRGVPNSAVASGFAKHFRNHPKSYDNIKFVLYFESTGKLYATPTAGGEPIALEESSPDYIKAKLGVGPDNYFTFYDQLRTTGTDIKAARNARAFVSLSANTLKRDLLQAVMRLRELREKQRVEFVVPKELQDLHPEIQREAWSNSAIVQICFQNEAERLAEDHYRAALQEMKQLIRDDVMNRFLEIEDLAVQRKYLEKFRKTFFSTQPASLFKLYGDVSEPKLVRDLLRDQQRKLLVDWETILKNGIVTDEALQKDIFARMAEKMSTIVEKTVPFCYKKMTAATSRASEFDLGSEVQTQTETQKEQTQTTEVTATREQTQELMYAPYDDAKAAEQKFLDKLPEFPAEDLLRSDPPLSYLESLIESGLSAKTQNENLRTQALPWKLSQNLFASESFKYSLQGQTNYMDAYKKDATFLLVQYIPDMQPNSIKITLITPEEAVNLGKKLEAESGSEGKVMNWIETPHQTLYAGQKPRPDRLPKEYNFSMEQIEFFNGDTDLLYRNLDQNSWLKTNTASKLSYLERVIMPHHEDKPNLIAALRLETERLFQESKPIFFAKMAVAEAPKLKPGHKRGAPS